MRSLFVSLPLLALSACTLPTLAVQPRYGRLDISGKAGAKSGGMGGSADVEQAGLDREETFTGRVDLKFGAPHLIALAQYPEFEGRGTLDVAISDGTNTIPASATVDSELELGQYDLALVFDLIPGDTLELAIGFGVAFVDLAFRFEEVGTGETVASDEQVPVPLVAAAASVWLGRLQVAGFAGAMEYTYEDDSVSYLDADVYARWKLFGGDELLRASLVAGYRLTEFELDYDDSSAEVNTDLSLDGAYFGLELSL